jgi:hypothetical protein
MKVTQFPEIEKLSQEIASAYGLAIDPPDEREEKEVDDLSLLGGLYRAYWMGRE